MSRSASRQIRFHQSESISLLFILQLRSCYQLFQHLFPGRFFFFFVTPQRSYQRVWSCCLHELHTQLSRKMSKTYESANVSEVEDHISLKYEIKKRLGKGVSDCLSLDFLLDPIKFEVNSLKSRRPEIRTNLLHAPLT